MEIEVGKKKKLTFHAQNTHPWMLSPISVCTSQYLQKRKGSTFIRQDKNRDKQKTHCLKNVL